MSEQLMDFFFYLQTVFYVIIKQDLGKKTQYNEPTAAFKVVNDFRDSLDNKQHCAALFVDFSKSFNTAKPCNNVL